MSMAFYPLVFVAVEVLFLENGPGEHNHE